MATKEEDKKRDVTLVPIARRHTLLNDITSLLKGHELSVEAEVIGHKFLLTTLSSDEEMWSDGLMQNNSTAQTISSYRKARLAASIKSIDNVPVSEMFELTEEFNKEEKILYSDPQYGKRAWQMSQLYIWLGELPMNVIDELAIKYQEMNKTRREAIEGIGNLSKRTPGGESKDMSSPEKESSSATQTSAE